MAYQVEEIHYTGRPTHLLGRFANIASCRQAILDHAGLVDMPNEEPFHAPIAGVIEGWFIGSTEYHIKAQPKTDAPPRS